MNIHPDLSRIFEGKRALLLDFDGTIGDTFALHEAAFEQVLKPYGLTFAYKDYIGRATGEVFMELFAAHQQPLSATLLRELVSAKRAAANALYATHLKFMEGAELFVHEAFRVGYLLAVGSSGSKRNIMAGIEGLRLRPYISDIITADDVQYGKPHPEIFETLLQRGGLKPSEALVVEDAPSGIEAALTAGIETVCIDPSLSASKYSDNPSVHFATFAQLLAVLKPPALRTD